LVAARICLGNSTGFLVHIELKCPNCGQPKNATPRRDSPSKARCGKCLADIHVPSWPEYRLQKKKERRDLLIGGCCAALALLLVMLFGYYLGQIRDSQVDAPLFGKWVPPNADKAHRGINIDWGSGKRCIQFYSVEYHPPQPGRPKGIHFGWRTKYEDKVSNYTVLEASKDNAVFKLKAEDFRGDKIDLVMIIDKGGKRLTLHGADQLRGFRHFFPGKPPHEFVRP
jgi:hypothetical protein